MSSEADIADLFSPCVYIGFLFSKGCTETRTDVGLRARANVVDIRYTKSAASEHAAGNCEFARGEVHDRILSRQNLKKESEGLLEVIERCSFEPRRTLDRDLPALREIELRHPWKR